MAVGRDLTYLLGENNVSNMFDKLYNPVARERNYDLSRTKYIADLLRAANGGVARTIKALNSD